MQGEIERDGFKLRYHIEGEGFPVVVIGSAYYYERTFPKALLEHCQFIYFDNRVFGGTCLKKMNQSDYELEKIYADIDALRYHLDLDKIVLVGHSGQSYMALEYAKKQPQHVSHVVMIGMSPQYDDISHEWAEKHWYDQASKERVLALRENEKKWPDEFIDKLPAPQNFIQAYVRNTPKIWYDYHYDAESLWDNVDFNIEGFEYIWKELFPKLDITKGLDSYKVPTVVMLGKYDGLIAPPISWTSVKDKFQNLDIHVFDKSGHTPQLEEPDLFTKRFLDVLGKI